MYSKAFVFITLLFSMALTSQAQARGGGASGLMLTANVYMYNVTVEQVPTAKAESKSSVYDIKLGYLTGSGLYFGGIYSMRNVTGSSSTDGKAMGASLGYFASNGFFAKGHYLVSAEYGTLKEGTGIQGDFGYITSVSSSVVVGVEMTYRSIEYKKDESNASLQKLRQDEMFPMFTIGLVF